MIANKADTRKLINHENALIAVEHFIFQPKIWWIWYASWYGTNSPFFPNMIPTMETIIKMFEHSIDMCISLAVQWNHFKIFFTLS